MNKALEVMWISCFWFLMPGVSVTARSSGAPGGRKRQRDEPGATHATQSHSVLGASATVTPSEYEPVESEPGAGARAPTDVAVHLLEDD